MSDIKLDGLGKRDMLAFRDTVKDREKVIRKSSARPVFNNYEANNIAEKLHPLKQFVKVDKIIKENDDVKTFVLVPDVDAGTKSLAYFKAGQYISVCVEIDGGIYRRPYTLSCSPKYALESKYTITIKRVKNGIVSNYFLDEIEEGDSFVVSAPSGDFCYSTLRDANHVIALAGGSGITPFVSMAEAIYDGIEDFELTILYGAKNKNDLIFREKLEDITCKLEKVNLVYILSEESDNEFTNGYIDKNIIEQYLKEENSFFVCGSVGFYNYMNDVLKEFDLPKKYIRHDLFMGEIELKSDSEYKVTVLTQDREINIICNGQETLLQAMEKNKIIVPNKCHVGECGFCRSKLISGKVKTFDEAIRASDKDYNYIHPCATYPESDIVIKLPN